MDVESASEGIALQKRKKEQEKKEKSELKEGVERILRGLPQFAGVCVCVYVWCKGLSHFAGVCVLVCVDVCS